MGTEQLLVDTAIFLVGLAGGIVLANSHRVKLPQVGKPHIHEHMLMAREWVNGKEVHIMVCDHKSHPRDIVRKVAD